MRKATFCKCGIFFDYFADREEGVLCPRCRAKIGLKNNRIGCNIQYDRQTDKLTWEPKNYRERHMIRQVVASSVKQCA